MARTIVALMALVAMWGVGGVWGSSALGQEEAPAPPIEPPPPAERITLPNGERAIRVSRLVDAAPEAVYRVWASGEGFEEAMGRPATIEPSPGGVFEVQWIPDAPEGERGSEGCEVLAALPGEMISFTWNAPPAFGELRERFTRVVVQVEDVGPELTRMTLTHLGWPEGDAFEEGRWSEVHDYFAGAWPWVCQMIVTHFEQPERRARYREAWCYLITDWSREDLMDTMTDEERATLGEHFQYLVGLMREGRLVIAGPCTDLDSPDRGPGIVIFYADSEGAAREIMEGDPAIEAGIFKASLHPFAMSVVRERDYAPR